MTSGDDRGRGGGNSTDHKPPPSLQRLEVDVGMVSRSGRPSQALSGHNRDDHGGARGNLLRRTLPGGDYYHIRAALPNQRLCTLGRGGRLSGTEATGGTGRESPPRFNLITLRSGCGITYRQKQQQIWRRRK